MGKNVLLHFFLFPTHNTFIRVWGDCTPPAFQRYMIYDESMETFLYKMERLCKTESSLSHYKTKDGFVKHVDTTPICY